MNLLDLMVKVGVDDQATNKIGALSGDLKGKLATAAKAGAVALAAVTAAAAGVTKALVSGVNEVAEYGDNIDKMSQKMGMSASAYQEWDAVMQHSGTSMETMKASMKTLANAAESNNEAFQRLGITQEQIASMSQEELFEATIAGLQNVTDTTERTYLAGQLLGRGATELGPLLNMSAEDTQAMRDRVHELGGVMSDEAVKASAAFEDSLQDLNTAMSGVKRNMIAEFLPGFTMVMDGLQELLVGDMDKGQELVEQGVEQIVSKIEEVGPKLIEVIGRLSEAVAPVLVEALGTLLAAIITEIITHLPDIMAAALKLVLALVSGFANGLVPLMDAANEVVQGALDAVGSFFMGMFQAGADLIQNIKDGAAQTASDMAAFFGGFIEDGLEAVLGFVGRMLDAGRNLWDNLKKGATGVGNTIADTFRSWIENGLGSILGFVGSMWNAGTSLITNLLNGAAQIGWNIASNFWDWLNNAYQQVLNFGSAFYSAGVSILNGLVQGIWDGFSNAASAVSQGLSWIRSYLPFSPAKRGPFSGRGWTLYSGESMMNGLAEGIENTAANAVRAMRNATEGVRDAVAGDVEMGISVSASSAQSGLLAEIRSLREDIRGMQLSLEIDGRAFAQATVGEMDRAMGTMARRAVAR